MKPTGADHPPDHRFHCGLEGRSPLPDHTYSYFPIAAPIWASKRRPDQGTTKNLMGRAVPTWKPTNLGVVAGKWEDDQRAVCHATTIV